MIRRSKRLFIALPNGSPRNPRPAVGGTNGDVPDSGALPQSVRRFRKGDRIEMSGKLISRADCGFDQNSEGVRFANQTFACCAEGIRTFKRLFNTEFH